MNDTVTLLTRRNVLSGLLLFIFAVLLYGPGEHTVSFDLSRYLVISSNVLEGNGFVTEFGYTFLGRPGYTLFLAGLIALSDYSLPVIVWVNAIASATLVLMLYIVGLRLLSFAAGIMGALLYLSSPHLVVASMFGIDPWWPALGLAAILLLMHSGGRPVLNGLIAGCLLFIAILIKEIAVLFLLFPLIFLIRPWFPNICRRRLLVFYGVIILGLLTWALLVYMSAAKDVGSIIFHYEKTAGEFHQPGIVEKIISFVSWFFTGVAHYFYNENSRVDLWDKLPLLTGIFIALPVFLFRVVKLDQQRIILLWIAVLFLPFIAACGNQGLRLSQALIFIGILYLIFADFLVLLGQRILQRPGVITQVSIATILILGLMLFQWEAGYGNRSFKNTALSKLFRDEPLNIYLGGTHLGEWFKKQAFDQPVVWMTDHEVASGLRWSSLNQLDTKLISSLGLEPIINANRKIGDTAIAIDAIPSAIKGHGGFKVYWTHPDFMNPPENPASKKIALVDGARNPAINHWLNSQTGVSKLTELTDYGRIFQVYELPAGFPEYHGPIHISKASLERLKWNQHNQPDYFQHIKQRFFVDLTFHQAVTFEQALQGVNSIDYIVTP